MKKYIILSLALFTGLSAHAAEATAKTISTDETFITAVLISLGALIALLLIAIYSIGNYVYLEHQKTGTKPPALVAMFGVFHNDMDFIAAEVTDTVIHDYDGIQEYDNDMPPWWVKGFYVTIIFAVSYLSYYHIFNWGQLQTEEFETEIAEAKAQFNSVDLVYEGPSEDEALVAEAAEAYQKTCKSCHGDKAQGLAGPNLTDKYWIYGGDVNTLYETIKFGRKGEGLMPAQGTRFSNEQIYGLASYIMSLQGSNPENPLPRKDTENIVFPEEK